MELRNGEHVPSSEPEKGSLPRIPEAPSLFVDIEHVAHSSEGPNALKTASNDHIRPPKSSASKNNPSPTLTVAPTHISVGPKTVPAIVIPDRKPASIQDIDNEEEDTTSQVHLQYPGRVEPILLTASPTPIHWLKQEEHFPIPIESLIQLPTGEAKPIPTIQHKFSEESSDAKTKREERQRRVKDEFMRAWNGYKENAWMHDELSPVSGGSRDPFGAWAATLVDSLDTMWIMGLEEEFVKAVKAVATIDFTTCARQDIPVFETTIRYLGGLLGAYDVSGQIHKTLLEKAIELGEILIGAFDTPNRMPDLYYRWKPAFASQRGRASSKSGVAELGTLSMEFTRLSQLTKDVKYYDAIARVTNALEEFQNLGTKLGGIFPEIIDASGCNRSASDINRNLHTNYTPMKLNHSLAAEGKGYEVPMPRVPKEPRPLKRKGGRRVTNLELSVIPGNPSKGYLRTVDDGPNDSKGKAKIVKRVESETALSSSSPEPKGDEVDISTTTSSPTLQPEEIPDIKPDDWDCVPQGLGFASGPGIRDIFSMGAKQDSAYEYFSKVCCVRH
jgi:mannosyl-oligosaccharide alpha-1,2-mannosidase